MNPADHWAHDRWRRGKLAVAADNASISGRIEHLLRDAGYEICATTSAADLIKEVSERSTRLVIVGNAVDGIAATELVPVLKGCAPGVQVILVGEDSQVPSLRRLRKEGIFYHLQVPVDAEDCDELRQAVECALRKCGMERPPRPVLRGPVGREAAKPC